MKYCFVVMLVIAFELSCSAYKNGKTYQQDFSLEYHQGSPYVLELQPGFMDNLQNGFCILGPVDEEARLAKLREFIMQNRPDLKNMLDQLQGVEPAKEIK